MKESFETIQRLVVSRQEVVYWVNEATLHQFRVEPTERDPGHEKGGRSVDQEVNRLFGI